MERRVNGRDRQEATSPVSLVRIQRIRSQRDRSHLREYRGRAYFGVVLGEVGRTESGQALVDYTLILAAVAIGCVVVILFLSGGLNGLFGSTGTRIHQAPLEPPVSSPGLTWPTSIDDCTDGGWRDFPQFVDESQCLDYVNGLAP